MALKNALFAIVCTAVLAVSAGARADQYRADEYLGLDLSKAVLSPKRLGPPTQFAPVPVEAKTEPRDNPQAAAKPVAEQPTAASTTRVRAARAPARAKLARRHSNPLDAQARDTRIQTWPCRTGGICNWQR